MKKFMFIIYENIYIYGSIWKYLPKDRKSCCENKKILILTHKKMNNIANTSKSIS